jgi:hypothetical protein
MIAEQNDDNGQKSVPIGTPRRNKYAVSFPWKDGQDNRL